MRNFFVRTRSYVLCICCLVVSGGVLFGAENLTGDWNHKAALTIKSSQVGADLSDFPVLVSKDILPSALLDADGGQAAKGDGGDIRFTSDLAGTTPLACEIVGFSTNNDPNLASAEVWVKLPTVSSSTDTVFYVWWGNGAASQPAANAATGSQAVWSNGFRAVYHLTGTYNGTSGEVLDSTSYQNHGAAHTSGPSSATGHIGGGQDFTAAGQALIIPNHASLEGMSELSMTAWANRESVGHGNNWGRLFAKNQHNGYALQGHHGDGVHHRIGGAWIGATAHTGSILSQWVYFSSSYDSAAAGGTGHVSTFGRSGGSLDLEVYNITGIGAGAVPVDGKDVYLGNRENLSRTMDGILDEVRIHAVARTPEWFAAEYNNQWSPGDFFQSVGAVLAASYTPTTATGVAVEGLTGQATTGTVTAGGGNGGPYTFAIAANASNGTATITNASTGAFSYTPTASYTGADSFTFTASDGITTTAATTVTLTIYARPTVSSASLETSQGIAANASLSGTAPSGKATTFSVVSGASNGVVTMTNTSTGAFTYTPTGGYTGADSFTFKLNDTLGDSSIGTMSITVHAAPVANNASLSVIANLAKNETLTATIPSGKSPTYSVVSNATNGTVVITNATTGAYTYTPASNFSGNDSFTFKVNDSLADSNTATVSVSVGGLQAVAGTLSTIVNAPAVGTLTASNPTSDPESFVVVTPPTNGSVTITNAATGAFTYTPTGGYSGADSFTFRATTTNMSSDPATVTITVQALDAQRPRFVSLPTLVLTTGTAWTYTPSVDTRHLSGSPNLVYSVISGPVSVSGSTFSWTPTAAAFQRVSIRVEDTNAGGVDVQHLLLRVTDTPGGSG